MTIDKYQKSLVTPQFYGQIGNQLFIIATTLAYAWDYDMTPIFPGLHTDKNRLVYNRDRLFFRLDASSPPRNFSHIFREEAPYDGKRIPYLKDVILDGYFQSWKHFDHHRDKLLEILAPSIETQTYLQSKYQDLLNSPKTVSIHVRTSGLRFHNTKQQPFLGFEYYEKCMDYFPADSLFVLFSDRINWCKKKFTERFPHKTFFFVEGNYGIEDLFLMSLCKHNIICNSTFSWWGAYLNRNSTKKVIVPEEWHGGGEICSDPKSTLYLPDWITVPYIFSSYPEDMYAYDASSQSCDPVWWN